MNENLKASDLNRNHLGRIVRVRINQGAECTDHLCGVSHSANVSTMHFGTSGEPSYSMGPVTTILTFMRLGDVTVNGSDAVEVSGAE